MKQIKYTLLNGHLILLLFLIVNIANAQDYHFSQFFNTPLAQNPALTGKFREDYRIGGVYRNQWKQINASFASTGIFADVNFRKNISSPNKIGVGVMVINDELGDDQYRNQYYQLSLAYHKTLDRLKRNRLSGGLQIGYVNKNLNTDNLIFNSQYNGWQQTNNPSGEILSGNSLGYVNVNTGLFWDCVISSKFDFYVGVSLFNLTQPKEQLVVAGESNKLGIRQNYNIGANYMLTKNISLLPAIQITRQLKAMDFNLGGAIGYSVISGKLNQGTVMLGAWYRTQDAVNVYGGIKYKNYQLGMSYDITVSSLNNIKNAPDIGRSKNVGAFEITLIYVGFLKRAVPNDLTVPCRFF